MDIIKVETPKGPVAQCRFSEIRAIEDASDFLGILYSCGTEILALDRMAFHESFFDLRSGLAGEILQKTSNYHKKLIVLGDFSDLDSKAWKDFIFESNRGGRVLFVQSLEAALDYLQ